MTTVGVTFCRCLIIITLRDYLFTQCKLFILEKPNSKHVHVAVVIPVCFSRQCCRIWQFGLLFDQLVTTFSFGDLPFWLLFWLLFEMNPKPLSNWFRNGLKPVLFRFETNSNINSKKVTSKNLFKTGFKLCLNWFLISF